MYSVYAEAMEVPVISSDGGKCEPKKAHSKDLLDVGKNFSDPLLIRTKKPYRMSPSSVLSQVKSFLPKMQEANSKLEERLKTALPEDFDIENIADCEQEVIEMNLAVFTEDDGSSDDGSECGDNDNNDSSDVESDSEAVATLGEITTANIQLPNGRRKPKRTMIEDLTGGAEVKVHDPDSEIRVDGRLATMISLSNKSEATSRHDRDGIADERHREVKRNSDLNR